MLETQFSQLTLELCSLDLCHSADEMEKSSGKKFWTGTKRRPRPVDWTNPMPLLMEYLYSTANLYASVWKVDCVRDRDEFQAVVDEIGLEQPQWQPSGEKVDLSEGDNEEESGEGGEDDEKLKGDLYKIDSSKLQPAQVSRNCFGSFGHCVFDIRASLNCLVLASCAAPRV